MVPEDILTILASKSFEILLCCIYTQVRPDAEQQFLGSSLTINVGDRAEDFSEGQKTWIYPNCGIK